MKILFRNAFHDTSSEVSCWSSNKARLVLDGRKLRRVLEELCAVDGCDCRSDIAITVDGAPATIVRFDPDVEDHETGLELALPPSDD